MLRALATDSDRAWLPRALAAVLMAWLMTGCSQPDRDRPNPPEQPWRSASPLTTTVLSEAAAPAEASPQQPPPRPLSDRDIDWQANAVMQTLGSIARTVKHTEYSHAQRVNVQQGLYVFDCSLMAQWVLKRAAPVAARTVSRGLGRPLAADFQRRIASVTAGSERGGWRRVERVQDAAAGDVIAWLKPKIIDSKNTGHVAFIALPPSRVPGYVDAYLVRVVDATSLLHADDTRGDDGSGFGLGTILLVVDPDTDAPRAYGWAGLAWRAFETSIAIGRPTR